MIISTRLAVVSGGATGIGREIAQTFAGRGDRVVIIGRRTELLRRASVDINQAVGSNLAMPVSADLTDPAQVRRAVTR